HSIVVVVARIPARRVADNQARVTVEAAPWLRLGWQSGSHIWHTSRGPFVLARHYCKRGALWLSGYCHRGRSVVNHHSSLRTMISLAFGDDQCPPPSKSHWEARA